MDQYDQLSTDRITLEAFDSADIGKLTVRSFKMQMGGQAFELQFERGKNVKKFCVQGHDAKLLAAYIALWS